MFCRCFVFLTTLFRPVISTPTGLIIARFAGLVQNYDCRSKGNSSPYSITERRVQGLIAVLGCQPASDVSQKKTGGRLPLLSARLAVTLAALKRTATNFAAW